MFRWVHLTALKMSQRVALRAARTVMGHFDVTGLFSLSINPSVRYDGGEPAMQRAFAAEFFEERWVVVITRDAIGPEISQQIPRLGSIRSACQENSEQ